MSNKTQIRGNKQIKDLSVTNDQIASNAGIELGKIAQSEELLKRDGSVPLTGDLDADNHKIKNLAAPVGNNDAVRKVDLDSAISAISSEIAAEQIARESADSALEGRMDVAESNIGALESGLAQEILDRQAGDQNLQDQIDALDGGLSTDLTALEARVTTAEGDISDLEAADVVIDGRLDAVESKNTEQDGRLDTAEGDIDSLEGRMDVVEDGLAQEILDRQAGVEEAKDYADQKIADLVNGAPEVLDTLKELADALNGDENFATTIAGQIGDLDSRLDTAEGDIVALKGRMDVVEGDISDLEAADVVIDGRLDSIESKNTEQDGRLDVVEGDISDLEAADVVIDGRLDSIESKNTEQDGRLTDLEADLAEATAGAFISREVPVGVVDGVNASFSLSNAVNPGSEQVYLNGILQNVGSLNDYTISGDTITFNQAPEVDSVILVSYISDAIIIGSGGSGSGGATNLNGLSDVNLVSSASGEVLKFNGTQWVNDSVSYNDLSNKPSLFSGAYADLTGKPSLFSGSYNDLTDKPVIDEVVLNNFNTSLSPSSGTLTLDVSAGSVVLGDLSASVTTWAFTNVPAGNGKVASVTVIIDGDTAQTYGDACSINGVSVSGGIKWSGGSAPAATNNFDMITFVIVRDNAGTVHVFGSSTTNFS